MCTTITILSTKGGVGKTTLTANLAGFLHSKGFRVLMIDADFQPALSSYFPLTEKADYGLSGLYRKSVPVQCCISKTPFGDLVYSDDPEGSLQEDAKNLPDGRIRLLSELAHLQGDYDFILIDTQGAGGAVQEAAVLAASRIITPIQATTLAIKELGRGTIGLMERLLPFEGLGVKLPAITGVLWSVDQTKICVDTVAQLKKLDFSFLGGGKIRFELAEAMISHSVAWKECDRQGKPLIELGYRRKKAIAEFGRVVTELLPQIEEVEG